MTYQIIYKRKFAKIWFLVEGQRFYWPPVVIDKSYLFQVSSYTFLIYNYYALNFYICYVKKKKTIWSKSITLKKRLWNVDTILVRNYKSKNLNSNVTIVFLDLITVLSRFCFQRKITRIETGSGKESKMCALLTERYVENRLGAMYGTRFEHMSTTVVRPLPRIFLFFFPLCSRSQARSLFLTHSLIQHRTFVMIPVVRLSCHVMYTGYRGNVRANVVFVRWYFRWHLSADDTYRRLYVTCTTLVARAAAAAVKRNRDWRGVSGVLFVVYDTGAALHHDCPGAGRGKADVVLDGDGVRKRYRRKRQRARVWDKQLQRGRLRERYCQRGRGVGDGDRPWFR